MSVPRLNRGNIRDGATIVGLGTFIPAIVILVVGGLMALLWGIGIFTSGVKGTGDVHRHQQDARNREHWSATFNSEFELIRSDQGNLTVLQEAATRRNATKQDQMNYGGAKVNCLSDVAAYNADAASILGHPWIPQELPAQINPSTYCGE